MEAETKTVTIDTLESEVKRFLDTLAPGKAATVVGLYGDLGAGKTTFVQTLAKRLGITEHVTSPTFVIQKVYALKRGKYSHLIHIDAYRLESSSELRALGWDELLKDPHNLIVVEWANLIEDILPEGAHKISLSVPEDATEGVRLISYYG